MNPTRDRGAADLVGQIRRDDGALSPLHHSAVVIDALIAARWGRDVFEAMHAGGLTAVNCSNIVWEGLEQSTEILAQWKVWLRDYSDILLQVYSVADIERAKSTNRLGIIIGWQNSTGFGEDLRCVPLFGELGLRVVQLTYNTANMAGSGCFESCDGGLTDFGHDLVAALNDARILIDLSYVGPQTTRQTIEASKQPVAFTHCGPRALKDHPRNKTDAELRLLSSRGGVVGVTMFPPFARHGNDSTLDDYFDAVEHVINICGEEHVGVATDFCENETPERMQFYARDKGYGRELNKLGKLIRPPGFERVEQYPNLTAAMERRGWSEARIRKVLGKNWVRLFGEVWR